MYTLAHIIKLQEKFNNLKQSHHSKYIANKNLHITINNHINNIKRKLQNINRTFCFPVDKLTKLTQEFHRVKLYLSNLQYRKIFIDNIIKSMKPPVIPIFEPNSELLEKCENIDNNITNIQNIISAITSGYIDLSYFYSHPIFNLEIPELNNYDYLDDYFYDITEEIKYLQNEINEINSDINIIDNIQYKFINAVDDICNAIETFNGAAENYINKLNIIKSQQNQLLNEKMQHILSRENFEWFDPLFKIHKYKDVLFIYNFVFSMTNKIMTLNKKNINKIEPSHIYNNSNNIYEFDNRRFSFAQGNIVDIFHFVSHELSTLILMNNQMIMMIFPNGQIFHITKDNIVQYIPAINRINTYNSLLNHTSIKKTKENEVQFVDFKCKLTYEIFNQLKSMKIFTKDYIMELAYNNGKITTIIIPQYGIYMVFH